MKVAIVCRMNQVRSTFSEFLLSSQYPEIELHSAGVGAVSNKLPIARVATIATEWGLNTFSLAPRHITEIREFIESCDLLLLAESSFSSFFSAWNLRATTKSFDQLTLDENFVPKDPVDIGESEFRVELSKIGYVAIRAIESEIITSPKFPIKIVIPLNASDAELAFTFAKFESNQDKGFLIDVDFRSPNTREFASPEECTFFDPTTLNVLCNPATLDSGRILTPSREYRVPEEILISKEFRTNIREFANIAPVTLISAPRCVQGLPIPDSYLAAISATSIVTVGC